MSSSVTVVISVLTSAVVTLGIEWAAKPRLEARKDRIVQRHKAERDIADNLGRIAAPARSIGTQLPKNLTPESRQRMIGYFNELRNRIIVCATEIDEAPPAAILHMDKGVREVVLVAAGIALGAAGTDTLRDKLSQELTSLLSIVVDLFNTPKWRFMRKRRLLREAQRAIADKKRRIYPQ